MTEIYQSHISSKFVIWLQFYNNISFEWYYLKSILHRIWHNILNFVSIRFYYQNFYKVPQCDVRPTPHKPFISLNCNHTRKENTVLVMRSFPERHCFGEVWPRAIPPRQRNHDCKYACITAINFSSHRVHRNSFHCNIFSVWLVEVIKTTCASVRYRCSIINQNLNLSRWHTRTARHDEGNRCILKTGQRA